MAAVKMYKCFRSKTLKMMKGDNAVWQERLKTTAKLSGYRKG
jgi:hypothetical protein